MNYLVGSGQVCLSVCQTDILCSVLVIVQMGFILNDRVICLLVGRPLHSRYAKDLSEYSVPRSRTKKAIVTVKAEKISPKFEIAIEEASSLKLSNDAALPCPSASSSLTPEPDNV
jgi:hypothetical protein